MTKTKKFILIVIIAIIVLLYAVVNNLGKNTSSAVLITPPKLVDPADIVDPNSKYEIPISLSPMSIKDALTSDVNKWPTYRNEKFGFSIKYPPGWGVTNEEFPGDVWSIGFWQSEHDSVFGASIDRSSLAEKTALESTPGSKPHVYTNRGYSFGFRSDEEFLSKVLPTLHFF